MATTCLVVSNVLIWDRFALVVLVKQKYTARSRTKPEHHVQHITMNYPSSKSVAPHSQSWPMTFLKETVASPSSWSAACQNARINHTSNGSLLGGNQTTRYCPRFPSASNPLKTVYTTARTLRHSKQASSWYRHKICSRHIWPLMLSQPGSS